MLADARGLYECVALSLGSRHWTALHLAGLVRELRDAIHAAIEECRTGGSSDVASTLQERTGGDSSTASRTPPGSRATRRDRRRR